MRLLIALTLLVGSLSVQASPDWLPSTPLLAQARVLDEQSFSGERRYPQSPLARISNRLRMEQSVTLSGEGQALYLQVPAQLAAGGLDELRRDLQGQGAQVLYWCRGRSCGASSLWANGIFANPRLTGADEQQQFLLLRLAAPREHYLQAYYLITRGTRPAYLQAEQLQAASLPELLPTPATLLAQLEADGVLYLMPPGVVPEAGWLQLLARTLQLNSTLRVSLQGAHAEAWRDALQEQGVRGSRLELDAGADPGLRVRWLR